MSTKINFTAEHQSQLDTLILKHLYRGSLIKGLIGTTLTVFDLLHSQSVQTIQKLHSSLKREIEINESTDEWSLTKYQQEKLAGMKEIRDLLSLIIGYRKYQDQKAADATAIRELKAKYTELKASQMTPEQQLAALESEIKSMGGTLEEEIATAVV